MANKKEIAVVVNPFEVPLKEFLDSIPDNVTVKEYLKDYSDSEIEIVEREVRNFNNLNKQ